MHNKNLFKTSLNGFSYSQNCMPKLDAKVT